MAGRTRAMLISLHEHFPIRVTDWLLSAILFSWGLTVLFLRPDVWALPTYSGLASVASQFTWAAVAIAVGLARLGALFVNGAVRRSPHLRGLGAFVAIFIWVQLSLGLMFSDAAGASVAVYPWLAFADIFNVYRAARDARASDNRARMWRQSAVSRVPGCS